MNLTQLLTLSVQCQASDLHLSPLTPPRLRIAGELMPVQEHVLFTPAALQTMLSALMTPQQHQQFSQTLELDFAIDLPAVGTFRVNVFQQMRGMAAVFRHIPAAIPTLSALGVPAVCEALLAQREGLILVTGPTGCGKSTTLAAMVDYLNRHQAYHIITIEDPIEFCHTSRKSLISQRQVARDTLSFASALRAAMREDPDVILVGEMRDVETMRLVLSAAETGHLVLSTVHTASAIRTLHRIMDAFSAAEKPMMCRVFAESLRAVICQTLIKKIAGGRVAAFEILLAIPAIKHLIREDKVAHMQTVLQTSRADGMCTMEQSYQALIEQKIIDPCALQEL